VIVVVVVVVVVVVGGFEDLDVGWEKSGQHHSISSIFYILACP